MQTPQEHVDVKRRTRIHAVADTTEIEPRVKSPLADFGIPKDELAYQAKGDASVLVEAWRKLDLAAHPHMREARNFVLTEWEKRTELHGRHDEPTVFQKHADFFQTLVSIKYSADDISNPGAMLSLLIQAS